MRLSENGMYNDPEGRVYSLKARSRLRASFIVCRKNNWKKIACKLFPLKKKLCYPIGKLWKLRSFVEIFTKY